MSHMTNLRRTECTIKMMYCMPLLLLFTFALLESRPNSSFVIYKRHTIKLSSNTFLLDSTGFYSLLELGTTTTNSCGMYVAIFKMWSSRTMLTQVIKYKLILNHIHMSRLANRIGIRRTAFESAYERKEYVQQ